MQVDLKKIKPIGIVLILGFAVLAVILCFTADMGVPEKYESLHETEYYLQNEETLDELTEELEQYVFPNLGGVTAYYVNLETNKVAVVIDSDSFGKTKAVLLRDFDESLFEFYEADD